MRTPVILILAGVFLAAAAVGGWVGEVEEADEVWDELPAGSAAVAVQANAEAKASEVIRV